MANDPPNPGSDTNPVGQALAEPGGVDLGRGVRLGPVHRRHEPDGVLNQWHRIYRGHTEIGSIDYDLCPACRQILILEIGLLDTEQRRGIGTRVLAHLHTELAGYRWFITPEKLTSRQFWPRIRAAYPGDYDNFGRAPARCPHIS